MTEINRGRLGTSRITEILKQKRNIAVINDNLLISPQISRLLFFPIKCLIVHSCAAFILYSLERGGNLVVQFQHQQFILKFAKNINFDPIQLIPTVTPHRKAQMSS